MASVIYPPMDRLIRALHHRKPSRLMHPWLSHPPRPLDDDLPDEDKKELEGMWNYTMEHRGQIGRIILENSYRAKNIYPTSVTHYYNSWRKIKPKANKTQRAVKMKVCKVKSSMKKLGNKANETKEKKVEEKNKNKKKPGLPEEIVDKIFSYLQLHEVARIKHKAFPPLITSWITDLPIDFKLWFDVLFSARNMRCLGMIRRENRSTNLYRLQFLDLHPTLVLKDSDSRLVPLSAEREASHSRLDYSKLSAMYVFIALLCTIRADLAGGRIKKYKWTFRDIHGDVLSTRGIMAQVHRHYTVYGLCYHCLHERIKSNNSPFMLPLSRAGLELYSQGHRADPYLVIYRISRWEPDRCITLWMLWVKGVIEYSQGFLGSLNWDWLPSLCFPREVN